MKNKLTREQIEKHPLIDQEYKKKMLAEYDANEAEVKQRARIGMYLLFFLFLVAAISLLNIG